MAIYFAPSLSACSIKVSHLTYELHRTHGFGVLPSIYSSTKNGSEQNDGHSHFNLVTLPRIPPIIEKEANNVKQSINEFGLCQMCRILNIEMGGPRQIIATDLFFAFTPWASSKEFEFWIFPKKTSN